MKYLLTFLFSLCLISFGFSQTLIPGTQKMYTIAGRQCLVSTPSDTSKKLFFLFSLVGNSTNDSSAAANQGPAKARRLSSSGYINDSFFIVTYIRTAGENLNISALSSMDGVLDWVFNNCTFVSTTDSTRNFMTGLSQGNQEVFRYLSGWGPNVGGYTPHHRNKFSKEVLLSPGADEDAKNNRNGSNYRPSGTRVWYGSADATTGTYYPNDIYIVMNGYNPNPKSLIDTIVGAGHTNTVWDSAWNKTAATSAKNTWLWLMQSQVAPPTPPTPSNNKINLSYNSRNLYDFNLIKGKTIRTLFDGNLSTNINQNGISQGNMVLPFVGYIRLDTFYNHMKLRYYDAAGGNTNLHITFYKDRTGVNTITSADSVFDYVFQTDNFNTWRTPTGIGIENLDSIRFLRIWTTDASAFDQTITELEIYGDAIGAAPSVYVTPVGTKTDPSKKGFGIGQVGDRNMHYVAMLGNNMRIIHPAAQINDPTDYSNALTSYKFHWKDLGLYPNGWNSSFLDSVRFYGMDYNHTIVGGSIKSLTSGQAATYDYNTWINGTLYKKYMVPGSDSIAFATFSGLGHYVAGLTAMFGSNATPPRSYVYSGPTNTSYGQTGFSYIAIVNEWIRDWQGAEGHSSAESYYAQLKVSYDSIKYIDPNMKVFIGALTSMDENAVNCLNLVHYFRTKNTVPFPADGLDFNTYINNSYGSQTFSGSDTAISPEKVKLRQILTSFVNLVDSCFGRITVNWTENGYATYSGSPYDVRVIAGKTLDETKADLSARVYMLAQTVPQGVSAIFYYWATSDNTVEFGTMQAMVDHFDGPGGAYSGTTLEPVGYMLNQQKTIEANYKWWSTLVRDGDSTGVNVTMKLHNTDPNKKLFQVAMGTYNGSTQATSIDLGANVSSANLIQWSYNSTTPTVTPLTITGTSVNVTAAEKKVYIEATYNAPAPGAQLLYRGFRWRG